MEDLLSASVECVILNPELPTHLPWSRSTGINHRIPAGTVNIFQDHAKRKDFSGPGDCPVVRCLYYMGDTNLPEYTNMARRIS